MLRKYGYLDTDALDEYTATLEGGLIAETNIRTTRSRSKGGKVKLPVGDVQGQGDQADERQVTRSDAPEARMERLLGAANDDPETIGWIDVNRPDIDFEEAAIGQFVSWDCDAYVPDISRLLAEDGEAAKKLGLFAGLIDTVSSGSGLTLPGLDPEDTNLTEMRAQVHVMQSVVQKAIAKRFVIAEDCDTDWKLFGVLQKQHLRVDDIDDERLVVIGKIKRRVDKGRWRRLAELLNFDVPLNRAERRRRELSPPAPGTEDQFITGPALELEVLALYR